MRAPLAKLGCHAKTCVQPAWEQILVSCVLGPHVRRREPQAGRIPVPPVEIVELDDRIGGAVGKPALLQPARGWVARLLSPTQARRFVLEPDQVPAELLGGRREFALLEFDADGRPVLQVLPGMRGELRIGVSRMSVAQMLADPALRLTDGGARLPLPYGARIRVELGPKTFMARVGGPPLQITAQPAGSRGTPQLAVA